MEAVEKGCICKQKTPLSKVSEAKGPTNSTSPTPAGLLLWTCCNTCRLIVHSATADRPTVYDTAAK
jgi:hypothetical protein